MARIKWLKGANIPRKDHAIAGVIVSFLLDAASGFLFGDSDDPGVLARARHLKDVYEVQDEPRQIVEPPMPAIQPGIALMRFSLFVAIPSGAFEKARKPFGADIAKALGISPDKVSEIAPGDFMAHVGYDEKPIDPCPPPSPSGALVASVAAIRDPLDIAALQNGWREEDIAGTGKGGDPSIHGGASATTTLSLAQMTLCLAPKDWGAKAADFWPWECDDWKPPGLDWKAPKMPPKKTPIDKPVHAPEAPASVVVDLLASADDEAAPAGFPSVSESADESEPESSALPFDAETIAKIRATIDDLKRTTKGDPNFNKINFALKRAGLPTLKKAQLAAL